jgi:hypothetical protein
VAVKQCRFSNGLRDLGATFPGIDNSPGYDLTFVADFYIFKLEFAAGAAIFISQL